MLLEVRQVKPPSKASKDVKICCPVRPGTEEYGPMLELSLTWGYEKL
jgi:hypothetical protein